MKVARTLALVGALALLSISFSFPFQSASAFIRPTTGSTFYISLGHPSTLPATCSTNRNGAFDTPFADGTLSHSVPARNSALVPLHDDIGTYYANLCNDTTYNYATLSSISSVVVTLRVDQATGPWDVDAQLFDLGTVSNPTTKVSLAFGAANFSTIHERFGQGCATSRALTIALTPSQGAQLTSGHILGLTLTISGPGSANFVDLCFGSWNPTWTTTTSVSIK